MFIYPLMYSIYTYMVAVYTCQEKVVLDLNYNFNSHGPYILVSKFKSKQGSTQTQQFPIAISFF